MQMPKGDPHPSTLPGFRGTRDPERSVTRSRSGRKKKRVEFEDIQPQDIPNPTENNFPRRCITQLPDGVSHIYYTRKKLMVPYDDTWSILSNVRQLLPNIDSSQIKSGNVSIAHLRMYLTVEANREDDITIARAFILFMMGHLWFQMANDTVPLGYLAAVNDLDWGSAILATLYHGLDTAVTTGGAITGFVKLLPYWFYEYCRVGHPIVKEERMGNLDLFGPSTLRAGITPVVVTSVSVHSLSQDFSLPGEAEGPGLGWHMEWTWQREMLPIGRLRDPPPMSSSYGTEELWHLTHGMRRLILAESARDAQRL
ncbi:hypothetical protein GIB67_025610 [Kingdonia uniflora]|uniref:Aminotransferase-like plant mobile domain-containing protein n=1 Tax=Kingdonia uniflora TaxID=39325 RepID=A0A7J7N356_9MAGN|nr:hypothetical protein GIB67_025610 [Kingdonia uniflora]